MNLPPLFNPSNDMALAANLQQYTPPRRIQQMEADLERLAALWDEGPWGWSLATRNHYLRQGIAADRLPTDEQLTELRRLSSRQFAVDYYQRLTVSLADVQGLVPCRARFISQGPTDAGAWTLPNDLGDGRLILKAPWSSSGRGNMVVDNDQMDEATRRRIDRIVTEQGGIMVEPFYEDKALDFAMEFHVGDDGVRFLGYSVFEADTTGHYSGNFVESQQSLLRRIGLPDELLTRLIAYHQTMLADLCYRGPVGIDMMRLADGRVHPCVEINFRMTMGLLALLLYNKGITTDQRLAGRADHGFEAAIRDGRLAITFRP